MTGELSEMPVLTGPNLSGGHHIDDNKTVAKQIKAIKPIMGEPDSPYFTANLDKQQGTATWVKALDIQWRKSIMSSILF